MSRQRTLFESERLQMTESIDLTIQSLIAYGATHKHWAIAWSGGKDSTALLTLVVYLLLSGRVPPPQTLTVLYADTRMELLPLAHAASAIRDELAEHAPALAAIGTPAANPQRMGPITLEARAWALELVLEVQREVNAAAAALGRPALDLLNAEEEARIRELIAARTWPDKWSGDEPRGDELLESVFADGTSQPLLWPRVPAREGR